MAIQRCGTHHLHLETLKSNPDYARKRAEIAELTSNVEKAARAKRAAGLFEPPPVKIIPVVVHGASPDRTGLRRLRRS